MLRAQKSVATSTRAREDAEGDGGDGIEEEEAGGAAVRAAAAGEAMRSSSSHNCSHFAEGRAMDNHIYNGYTRIYRYLQRIYNGSTTDLQRIDRSAIMRIHRSI